MEAIFEGGDKGNVLLFHLEDLLLPFCESIVWIKFHKDFEMLLTPESSNKWAAQQPTAREKSEMKAAQTALLICLCGTVWEDGIYEVGSQVWEVKTKPPESLTIWGVLEVLLRERQ